MTSVLAIDPGPQESAYAIIDADTRRPVQFGKVPNADLRHLLRSRGQDSVTIEMIGSYGMAVGAEVFETCVWIGRFQEAAHYGSHAFANLVLRTDVKLHHCHSRSAKDPNIVRALLDRFAPGQPNYGKGTKVEPGWFHGFFKDVWQAYALAVVVADRLDPDYLA